MILAESQVFRNLKTCFVFADTLSERKRRIITTWHSAHQQITDNWDRRPHHRRREKIVKSPLLPSLRTRCRQAEIMDQPDLDEYVHQTALAGLARVNSISRSSAIVWPAIRRAAKSRVARTLRVLDVACGGGDIAIAVKNRAEKAGLSLDVAGCDISSTALEYAAVRAAQERLNVRFFQANAITDSLPNSYDVMMCSLFLHHLDEREAISLLANMSRSTRHMLIVNDLIRSRFGYWLALIGTRLLTRSPVVHVDGPLSVQSAFRVHEVLSLAESAGLVDVRVTRHWPQRFLLTWESP
jgi:2-polyprenyl-3-methyl-5-hydroxy-6-metoxy-1,4-benzoquinol methylase